MIGQTCGQVQSCCAALFIDLLALAGCGPVPATVASTASNPASRPAASVPRSQVNLSPVFGGKTTSVRIYLIALGDNGRSGPRIGCGDSVIPVTRSTPPTGAPLSAAMRLLLNDHRPYYGRSGLYNALYQARLRLQRATVINGRATIHLVGRLNLRGVCDDPRAAAELRRTARQFPTVHSVAIFVNNVPLWRVLAQK